MERISRLDSARKPVAAPRQPKDYSDRELIAGCGGGDGGAWNEFVRRYTAFIKRQIVKALLSRYESVLAGDEDVVLEIYHLIFEKLFLGGTLRKLKDPDKIRPWLKTVAVNRTRDWLQTKRSIRMLADEQARRGTVRLQDPVTQDGLLTVGDVTLYPVNEIEEANKGMDEVLQGMVDPSPVSPSCSCGAELENVLRDLAELTEKEKWSLRVKVLFYSPLDDAEIDALAGFLGRSDEEVRGQLSTLADRLLEDACSRARGEEEAGRSWALLSALRARLDEAMRRGSLSQEEIEEREAVLERRARRTEGLIRSAGQLIEPSNEEIARILGIEPEKADYVGVLVYRARRALRKRKKMREHQN